VKVIVAWSGGKDSAIALERVLKNDRLQVVGLLTTVSLPYDRVTMHGVRRTLIALQAERVGLPLHTIRLPPSPSNEVYDRLMGSALQGLKGQGVAGVVFGDIFLEDVRAYREQQLAERGMEALFPLWGEASEKLVAHFLAQGYRAVVTCVDTQVLPAEFCGRWLDETFFASLPEGVDRCGENGEFHTFVTAAPFFAQPIQVQVGERVQHDRFVYCDLTESR